MSNTDPYAGIGGNYRIDEAGNRVPDEEWPKQYLADKGQDVPEPAPQAPTKASAKTVKATEE